MGFNFVREGGLRSTGSASGENITVQRLGKGNEAVDYLVGVFSRRAPTTAARQPLYGQPLHCVLLYCCYAVLGVLLFFCAAVKDQAKLHRLAVTNVAVAAKRAKRKTPCVVGVSDLSRSSLPPAVTSCIARATINRYNGACAGLGGAGVVWAMTSEEDDQEDEMDRFALAGVRSAIEGEGFPTICGGVFLLCSLNERVTLLGFLYVRLWWHLLFVDVGCS